MNGRYLDADELAGYVERQILDDLTRLVRWEDGTYRFDPHSRWSAPPIVRLSIEGAMIEASRRVDEQKRFVTIFRDPYQLLGVRDLPDARAVLLIEWPSRGGNALPSQDLSVSIEYQGPGEQRRLLRAQAHSSAGRLGSSP